jgi:hypothetical protein
MTLLGAPGPLPTAGRRRPVGAVGAVGVLSRIRDEQRRLDPMLEDLDPLETPERVMTLLEDALLSLREAAEQLRRLEQSQVVPSRRLEHMPGRQL